MNKISVFGFLLIATLVGADVHADIMVGGPCMVVDGSAISSSLILTRSKTDNSARLNFYGDKVILDYARYDQVKIGLIRHTVGQEIIKPSPFPITTCIGRAQNNAGYTAATPPYKYYGAIELRHQASGSIVEFHISATNPDDAERAFSSIRNCLQGFKLGLYSKAALTSDAMRCEEP